MSAFSESWLAELALELAIGLGFALAGGMVALRLRLPVYLGYLSAGIGLGFAFAAQGRDTTILSWVAQVAVAALLFMLALRFPLRPLRDRPIVSLLVAGQFLAVTVVAASIAAQLGADGRAALVIGSAFATSSALVVAARLEGRSARVTREFVAACSLIQGAIALTIIFLGPSVLPVTEPLQLRALLPLLLLPAGMFVGRIMLVRVLPRFHDPAGELSQLTVVGIVLVAVVAPSIQLGLPLAVAALAAGWLVGSVGHARAITIPIARHRQAFIAAFLVGLGGQLDLPALIARPEALILLGTLLALKFASSVFVAGWAGLPRPQAILAGAALAPLGEVAFIVGQEGLARDLIQPADQQLILAGAAASVAATSIAVPAARSATYARLSGQL